MTKADVNERRHWLYERLLNGLQPSSTVVGMQQEGGDQPVPTSHTLTRMDDLLQSKPKLMTMIYVIRNKKEVLLGFKARGFGAGLWNAFGGKVEHGVDSSIASSALRELEEEAGLSIEDGDETKMTPIGVIFFRYPQQEERSKEYLEVHLFVIDMDTVSVTGTIRESEEMTPIDWFSFDNVPLSKMWVDDQYWLKNMLLGYSASSSGTYRFAGFFQFFGMEQIEQYSVLEGDVESGLHHTILSLHDEYHSSLQE